ncbi:MAG: type II toxin-antitoxin system VapC family toxin [Bryobacteraceae bacterium]
MLALDSNTLIYYFKGVGRVAEHLQATPPREIGIPSIVLYELEVGLGRLGQREHRRRELAQLLQLVRILPFDESSARAAAGIRVRLETLGMPIGPLDTLIAGTALGHGAVLVTHNTGEFHRVPGLTVMDWF